MTTIHPTSTVNVEATINAHFRSALNALSLPLGLATRPTIIADMPEEVAVFPSISFFHIPMAFSELFQGRNADIGDSVEKGRGMLDVSAWVSRNSINWQAQLRAMQSMIEDVAVSTKNLVILDYNADPSNPVATNYKLDFRAPQPVSTAPDPNPDIYRRRVLVVYFWTYRSTN